MMGSVPASANLQADGPDPMETIRLRMPSKAPGTPGRHRLDPHLVQRISEKSVSDDEPLSARVWNWVRAVTGGPGALFKVPPIVIGWCILLNLFKKESRNETIALLLFLGVVALLVAGALWAYHRWIHWEHRAKLLAALIVLLGTPALVYLHRSRHKTFAAVVATAGAAVATYGVTRVGDEDVAAWVEVVAGMLHMVEGLRVFTTKASETSEAHD